MLSQFTSAASQQINDLLQVVNARDKVCGGILFLSCSCEILSPGVSVSLQHAQKDEEARPTLNVHVAEPPDVIESLKLGRQERRVSYHIRARARASVANRADDALGIAGSHRYVMVAQNSARRAAASGRARNATARVPRQQHRCSDIVPIPIGRHGEVH